MGYIYKIENRINNKVYIGQTIKPYQKRLAQHINNSTKEYFSQIVLYKAFNKYGIENFEFSVIEEIENDKLDEREKYWIKHYDSYMHGYNSTIGGRDISLYDWDEQEIVDLYNQLKSARKVAEYYKCDHSTIDSILNRNNVHRFTQREQKAKPVKIIKDGFSMKFTDTIETTQWFIDNNIPTTKNFNSVKASICRSIKKNMPYFGYKIINL